MILLTIGHGPFVGLSVGEKVCGTGVEILHLMSGRVIPVCFTRLRTVPDGRPKLVAAPSGPSMCHSVSVRVSGMCRPSRFLRPDSGEPTKEDDWRKYQDMGVDRL